MKLYFQIGYTISMGLLRSGEKNEKKEIKNFKKKLTRKPWKKGKQEKVEEINNYYTISMGIHTNDDWKSVSQQLMETKLEK